jgi:Meckel syndrome type 1 protein
MDALSLLPVPTSAAPAGALDGHATGDAFLAMLGALLAPAAADGPVAAEGDAILALPRDVPGPPDQVPEAAVAAKAEAWTLIAAMPVATVGPLAAAAPAPDEAGTPMPKDESLADDEDVATVASAPREPGPPLTPAASAADTPIPPTSSPQPPTGGFGAERDGARGPTGLRQERQPVPLADAPSAPATKPPGTHPAPASPPSGEASADATPPAAAPRPTVIPTADLAPASRPMPSPEAPRADAAPAPEAPEPPLASPVISTIAPRQVATRSDAPPLRQLSDRAATAPVSEESPPRQAASFAVPSPDVRIEPVTTSAPLETARPPSDPLPAAAPPAVPAATTAAASDLLPPAPEAAALSPAPAPAEPAPAARAAPVAWPARQIAPFAVALALGPDASLNLTLEPVELGRVEIAIERNGTEAIISVNAERPETLALLQRDRAELERALATAGLGGEGRGATLSFGAGGDSGERRERGGHHAQPSRNGAETIVVPHETRRRGLLDLAV